MIRLANGSSFILATERCDDESDDTIVSTKIAEQSGCNRQNREDIPNHSYQDVTTRFNHPRINYYDSRSVENEFPSLYLIEIIENQEQDEEARLVLD